MHGSVTTIHTDGLKVHTYAAPESGWAVNTHIIDLENQLFVIDAQYTLDFAREVVEFAATLNKPITRLYVTHYHPDHLLGAAAFSLPIHGLAEVARKVDEVGDRVAGEERAKVGNSVPDHAERISEIVREGEEKVDGTLLRYIALRHAETADALMIALPEHDILITQDLLYHQVHVFVGELAFESWRVALSTYSALNFGTLLPGHGSPGGVALWTHMADYLDVAERTWKSSDSAEAFRNKMIGFFPNHRGALLLQHEGRFLYK